MVLSLVISRQLCSCSSYVGHVVRLARLPMLNEFTTVLQGCESCYAKKSIISENHRFFLEPPHESAWWKDEAMVYLVLSAYVVQQVEVQILPF
jgi:hypothetical protein